MPETAGLKLTDLPAEDDRRAIFAFAMTFIALLMSGFFACSVFAAEPANMDPDAQIESLQRKQRELLDEVKSKLAALPEGEKRTQLAAIAAEIEKRMEEMGPPTVYLSVSDDKNISPPMLVWVTRARRRIEDCGTRHFPVQDGKKLYGRALLSMRVDRDGQLLETRVERSSGNTSLDQHAQKVVSASAPFGKWPAKVRNNSTKQFENVLLFSTFNFAKDDKPLSPELPVDQRCNWQG